MTLKDEIKKFNEQIMSAVTPETMNIMTRAAEELVESGIVNRALAKGDIMPPFSLPDANGKTVSSEELLAEGPLVINFYRGNW